jgi:hypothetical protein
MTLVRRPWRNIMQMFYCFIVLLSHRFYSYPPVYVRTNQDRLARLYAVTGLYLMKKSLRTDLRIYACYPSESIRGRRLSRQKTPDKHNPKLLSLEPPPTFANPLLVMQRGKGSNSLQTFPGIGDLVVGR